MAQDSIFAYIRDVYAPVFDERVDHNLEVIGNIPEDLHGVYVQNNPNPQFPPEGLYHWFDGDGMIHGVQLRGGQASYRNRYVQTQSFQEEKTAQKNLWRGILEPFAPDSQRSYDKDTANTDLIFHNGQLLATWWLSGQPYAIDPITLNTKGAETFSDTLGTMRVAAHPKVDPRTGELIVFSYNPYQQPYLSGGVISAEGRVTHRSQLDCPLPSLFHDIAITPNHTIFLDLPMHWDVQKLKEGKRRIRFNKDRPSRFGVMPRYDNGASCQWFELPACYIYHTINAREEKNEQGHTIVVMTACRIEDPLPYLDHEREPEIPRLFFLRLHPYLYEFRFNLHTGKADQKQLDDVPTEFPRINDRYMGVQSTWAYHPRVAKEKTLLFDGFIKYNTHTGQGKHVVYGEGRIGGETVFAPRSFSRSELETQAEDDGYVITFVRDRRKERSELVIYDAQSLDLCAQVIIPRRVPFGFHAEWAPQ